MTFVLKVEAEHNLIKEDNHVWLMRINTNVSALAAQRAMSEHTRNIENTSGKISSGTRVRSAADDAASLAIGHKQKTNVRSQNQAIRNANDAVSQFQTAEGAMNEISSMLGRLKELSLQAANGTLLDDDRAHINFEYMQTRREIERIARSTRFMSNDLLQDRAGKASDFMIGINNDSNSKMRVNSTEFTVTEFSLGLVDSNVVNADEAQHNLQHIDDAIRILSEKRAKLGSYHNKVQSAINNLETSKENESAAMSRSLDADMAYETSEKLRSEGKLMAASAVLSQTSQLSSMALKLLQN